MRRLRRRVRQLSLRRGRHTEGLVVSGREECASVRRHSSGPDRRLCDWTGDEYGGNQRQADRMGDGHPPTPDDTSSATEARDLSVETACRGRPLTDAPYRSDGMTTPRTSPRPMETNPSRSARARMITSSPSSRNVRVPPDASAIALRPPSVISRRLPYPSGVGDEMVPEPSRSPGRRLQPFQSYSRQFR